MSALAKEMAKLVEECLEAAPATAGAHETAVASFGAYRSRPLTEIPDAALSGHADALTSIVRAKLSACLSKWRTGRELAVVRDELHRRTQEPHP